MTNVDIDYVSPTHFVSLICLNIDKISINIQYYAHIATIGLVILNLLVL